MHFGYHGGKCCGMKVIYGFGDPEDMLEELPACNHPNPTEWNPFGNRPDVNGHHVSSSDRFFIDKAPRETYVKRLDRYLKYAEKHQAQGIIEVVLAGSIQMKQWRRRLTNRGFKLVNRCVNSNSGRICHVFHKNMGEV